MNARYGSWSIRLLLKNATCETKNIICEPFVTPVLFGALVADATLLANATRRSLACRVKTKQSLIQPFHLLLPGLLHPWPNVRYLAKSSNYGLSDLRKDASKGVARLRVYKRVGPAW